MEQSDEAVIFESLTRSSNLSLRLSENAQIYRPTTTSGIPQLQSPRSAEEHSGSELSNGSISSSFPSSFDVPFGHERSSSFSDPEASRSPLLDTGSLDLSITIHFKNDGSVKA